MNKDNQTEIDWFYTALEKTIAVNGYAEAEPMIKIKCLELTKDDYGLNRMAAQELFDWVMSSVKSKENAHA